MHYACKRKHAVDVFDKLSFLNIKLYGSYLTTKYSCSVSSLTGEINSTAVRYCQTANQNKSLETIPALFTDTGLAFASQHSLRLWKNEVFSGPLPPLTHCLERRLLNYFVSLLKSERQWQQLPSLQCLVHVVQLPVLAQS